MSKSFRKKPVEIEAIQWTGDNEIEIMDFVGKRLKVNKPPAAMEHDTIVPHSAYCIHIETLEGVMTAQRMDWVIKGIYGEFYPCKPDIFEKTYEIVTSPQPPTVDTGGKVLRWVKASERLPLNNKLIPCRTSRGRYIVTSQAKGEWDDYPMDDEGGERVFEWLEEMESTPDQPPPEAGMSQEDTPSISENIDFTPQSKEGRK